VSTDPAIPSGFGAGAVSQTGATPLPSYTPPGRFGSPLEESYWHDLEGDARTPDLALLAIAENAAARGDAIAVRVVEETRLLLDAHATVEENLSRLAEEARGIISRRRDALAEHASKSAAAIRAGSKGPAAPDESAYASALRAIASEATVALVEVGEAAGLVESRLALWVTPPMRRREALATLAETVAEAGPLLDRLQVLLDRDAYARGLFSGGLTAGGERGFANMLRRNTLDEIRNGARRDPAVLSAPVVLRNALTAPSTLEVMRRWEADEIRTLEDVRETVAGYAPADEIAADAAEVAA
jgi:hypothetical protein